MAQLKARKRMCFDLTPEVTMAIKLAAAKNSMTTGQVVANAMQIIYPRELREATEAITAQEKQSIKV